MTRDAVPCGDRRRISPFHLRTRKTSAERELLVTEPYEQTPPHRITLPALSRRAGVRVFHSAGYTAPSALARSPVTHLKSVANDLIAGLFIELFN